MSKKKTSFLKTVKVNDSDELILGIAKRPKKGSTTGYTIDPAATGGRKSVFITSYDMDDATNNLIIPAILKAVRRGDSIIVVDDGWIHNNASMFLHSHGYNIVAFNAIEPSKTQFCYDPFVAFAPGVDDAEARDAIARFARATTFNLPVDPKKYDRNEVFAAKTLAYSILQLRLSAYHAGKCERGELIRGNDFFMDPARYPDKELGEEVAKAIAAAPKGLTAHATSMAEQIIAPALGTSSPVTPLYAEAGTVFPGYIDREFYDITRFPEEKTALFISAPYGLSAETLPAPAGIFASMVSILIAAAKKNGGTLKTSVSMALIPLTNSGRIPDIASLLKTFDAIGVQALLYQTIAEDAHIIYGDANYNDMLAACACCVNFDIEKPDVIYAYDEQKDRFLDMADLSLRRGDVAGVPDLSYLYHKNKSIILPLFDKSLPVAAPVKPRMDDFECFDEFMEDSLINQVRINNGLSFEQSEKDIQIGISPIAAKWMEPDSVLYEPVANTLNLQMGYGEIPLMDPDMNMLDEETSPNWETPYISTLFSVAVTPPKAGEAEKEAFFKNKKLSVNVYVVADPTCKKSAFSPNFNRGERFVAGYDFDFAEEEGGMDKYIQQTKDGPVFRMKLILADFNLLGDAYQTFEQQKKAHLYSPNGKYKLEFRLSTDGKNFKTYASLNVRMFAPKKYSPTIIPEAKRQAWAEILGQD